MKNISATLLLPTLMMLVFSAKAQVSDSTKSAEKEYRFQLQQIPEIYNSIRRFNVISDYENRPDIHEFNLNVQTFLQQHDRNPYTLAENYRFLKEHHFDFNGKLSEFSFQDIYLSLWRAKIINIRSELSLREYSDYGVNFLLQNGITDFREYMRFITLLMQEHLEYHYDPDRLRFSGGHSEGVVDLVEILQTFHTRENTAVAGVCRDVHDMGARMMREICSGYYNYYYPNKKIDFEQYIFVQSWATQASQHMTISFIDPIDSRKVYELDWGRLTEKYNSLGYDHGRNYGNAYRIWKFDSKRQYFKAIDAKKTALGNLLDDYLYTEQDFDSFSGIKNIEPYSAADMRRDFNSGLKFNVAFGTMVQNQKFALSTLAYRLNKGRSSGPIHLSCLFTLQTLVMEELDKKNFLYPNYHFTTAMVLYEYPRIIAKLSTRPLKINKNTAASLYADNSVESIIYQDFFEATDIKKYNGTQQSADGAIQLIQGLKLQFKGENPIFGAEMRIQNRGFLAAREVRLMSGNLGSLFSNAVMVSPAQDLILKWHYKHSPELQLSGKTILELTNQQNVIVSQQLSCSEKLSNAGFVQFNAGMNKLLRGLPYFWYPVNRNWIELSYLNRDKNTKIGIALRQFNDRELTLSAQASFFH